MFNPYINENSFIPYPYFNQNQTPERPSKIQRIAKDFFDTRPIVTANSYPFISQSQNVHFDPYTNTNTFAEECSIYPPNSSGIDLSQIPIIPPDDPIPNTYVPYERYSDIDYETYGQQFSSYPVPSSLGASNLIQTPVIRSDFPKHDLSSFHNSSTNQNNRVESKKHLNVVSPPDDCVISIKRLYHDQNLSENLQKALDKANMDKVTLAKKIEAYYPNSFNYKMLTTSIRCILAKKRSTLDLRIIDAINNILGCQIFNLSEQYIQKYKIEENVPIQAEECSILQSDLKRCDLYLYDLINLINSKKFLNRASIGNKYQLKKLNAGNLSQVLRQQNNKALWPCVIDRIHAIFGKTIFSKRPYAKMNTPFSNVLITPGPEVQKRLIATLNQCSFLKPKKIVALINDNQVEETDVTNWLNKENIALTQFQAHRLNEILDEKIFNI